MCGIVGVVNYREDISSQHTILENMTNAIEKRGPDEQGIFLDKQIGRAHV